MRIQILCITIIFTLTSFISLLAQGFQPPAKGKAVIYFVNFKKKDSFEYFHQDKYIGIIKKGGNYLRIECEPGEHLFWASAENKEFVTATLLEGGSYIVVCAAKMGMWSKRVKLTPIVEDDDLFLKSKILINENEPVKITESAIEVRNNELVDFIANIMDRYKNDWKNKYDFPIISPDMAISPDAMK